jgi:RNA polymerase sigma-70 factor (ECF subfamily)
MTRVESEQSPLHAALADAYTRSHKRLRAVAFRFAEHDADDLVHDAFVRALEGGDSFRHHSSATTWLYRIVINAGIDRRRRGQRRSESALSGDVESKSPQLLDVLAVRDAFHRLPLEDQQVCMLFDILGHTHAEIAVALDIPVGTSKRRLFSARRRLRARFMGTRVPPTSPARRPMRGTARS